jgi:hypothetical protein
MYYDSRMSAFMGAATMQQQCSKRTTAYLLSSSYLCMIFLRKVLRRTFLRDEKEKVQHSIKVQQYVTRFLAGLIWIFWTENRIS